MADAGFGEGCAGEQEEGGADEQEDGGDDDNSSSRADGKGDREDELEGVRSLGLWLCLSLLLS